MRKIPKVRDDTGYGGFIYVLTAKNQHFETVSKVGYAANWRTRIGALALCHPDPMSLRVAYVGEVTHRLNDEKGEMFGPSGWAAAKIERDVHRHLDKDRLHGEWFIDLGQIIPQIKRSAKRLKFGLADVPDIGGPIILSFGPRLGEYGRKSKDSHLNIFDNRDPRDIRAAIKAKIEANDLTAERPKWLDM